MKIVFAAILFFFLFGVNQAKSQDSYSGDTVYIVIADTNQTVALDTAQTIILQAGKEWPQYFKMGKHHIKNPLYTIAEDVAGKSKATTIVLILLTGPLGGHRLYLGTKPIVPIVYTLTLGGGVGILPFIDLVVVCFSKDMKRFENNDKIFMWAK